MGLTIRTLAAACLLALAACTDEDPCDDYVQYLCDCHADDPEFDCAELRVTYEKANASQQNGCALDLDTLKAEDAQDSGFSCEV